MYRGLNVFYILLLLLLAVAIIANPCNGQMFTKCGGWITGDRGVIHSPNYPYPFPMPINCRWIIKVPITKKVVVHFTQYFLKQAFFVTEYVEYVNDHTFSGESKLGEISFEDNIRLLISYMPYLVFDLLLWQHASDIHLRVSSNLEEVYGFNITYEFLDRDATRTHEDSCSVVECSFLGHCLAAVDFSSYSCHCFHGYFGSKCQYGPKCDPVKGINRCNNGGRCRYVYGSMVNVCQCPPGYVGSTCKETEHTEKTACTELRCSQDCGLSGDGLFTCSCREGFMLGSDNVTCTEQVMFRVKVAVHYERVLINWNPDVASRQILERLRLASVSSAERLKFDIFHNRPTDHLLTLGYHVFVDQQDVTVACETLQDPGLYLSVDNQSVSLYNVSVDYHPELRLLDVENNYAGAPVLEGHTMSLVCTARGSPLMTFRWYKDQLLFNVSLTARNVWEVLLEDQPNRRRLSVLNVDGVTVHDGGEFTCEIEDYGYAQRKSVTVDVIRLPRVSLTPMVVNLLEGQATLFRCLSTDDTMMTFTYQWMLNRTNLNSLEPKNGEVVELMFPSGSLLRVLRLSESGNYTCCVRNEAGRRCSSSFVRLISANLTRMTCQSDSRDGLSWHVTYSDHTDIQKCPPNSSSSSIAGVSKRRCLSDGRTTYWAKPNYASCHSDQLDFLHEQLEGLRLGYQPNDLTAVWEALHNFTKAHSAFTIAGDLEMVAEILDSLMETVVKFPYLAPNHLSSSFSFKAVADIANRLLCELRMANTFEKEDMTFGARLLHICESLSRLGHLNGNEAFVRNVTLTKLKFSVVNTTVTLTEGGEEITKFYRNAAELPNMSDHLSAMSHRAKPLVGEQTLSGERMMVVLQVFLDSDLFAVLRVKNPRSEEDELNSSIVSLFLLDGRDGGVSPSNTESVMAPIEFSQSPSNSLPAHWESKCIAWYTQDRSSLVGEWKEDVCELIHRSSTSIRCLCPVPGHYTVVVMATTITTTVGVHSFSDHILIAGCVLAMSCLCVGLLIYFVCRRGVCRRRLRRHTNLLHLNLVTALSGLHINCVVCLLSSSQQTSVCAVGQSTQHLLMLTVFTFLLMEAIQVYQAIQQKRRPPGINPTLDCHFTCLTSVTLGWGIPTVVTLCAYILSEVFGLKDKCQIWCWHSVLSGHHITLLVPVVSLALAHLSMMALCLVLIHRLRGEGHPADSVKFLCTVLRSLILHILLLLFLITGDRIEDGSTLADRVVFVVADLLTTVTVLAFFVRWKLRDRVVSLFSVLSVVHKPSIAMESFRTYLPPDDVDECDDEGVSPIQE